MTTAQIQIPPKLIPVFSPLTSRIRAAYGGRGSGKTRTFAKMTAVRAYMAAEAGQSGVILCGREFMNSLEDSSFAEVKAAIASEPWLAGYFDVGEKYIRTRNRKVSYIFCGLRTNLDSVKSKARILIAWIDEAESVSEAAWLKLLPTVREEGSEVWVTWNPEDEHSPTRRRFREHAVEINWQDNPWFPDTLNEQRLNDLRTLSPEDYAWVWEGDIRRKSEAQILCGKWRVDDFEPQPHWDGPYHGLDFGFAQDPTAAVRCWVSDNRLYIEREAGAVGLELDKTAAFIEDAIPGFSRYVVRADSARPESISYLRRHGMERIDGVKKWEGSVEDGISHMRSYDEIVVHTRCVKVAEECRKYSYKVDRLTGDVLPIIIDANNHYIDAIRYAINPLIKDTSIGEIDFFVR